MWGNPDLERFQRHPYGKYRLMFRLGVSPAFDEKLPINKDSKNDRCQRLTQVFKSTWCCSHLSCTPTWEYLS